MCGKPGAGVRLCSSECVHRSIVNSQRATYLPFAIVIEFRVKNVSPLFPSHTHTHTLTHRHRHTEKNKRELLSPVHYNRRIEWNCRHLCYISILITDEQHRTMDGSVLFMACPCHFNGMLHPIRPSIQSDRVNERAR